MSVVDRSQPAAGASYDLFGNGRTALKVSTGKYLSGVNTGVEIANGNNPMVTTVANVTRTWRDDNSDYKANCDLSNPLANGECGQVQNLNFGKNNPWRRATLTKCFTGLACVRTSGMWIPRSATSSRRPYR